MKPDDKPPRARRPHPEYPDFLVDTEGNVWRTTIRHCELPEPKKMVPFRKGVYRGVSVCNAVRSVTITVHRLVLETFVGLRPTGYQAAHLNGNGSDNRLENLKWSTVKENANHKTLHGTQMFGTRNHQSKLDDETVRKIRQDHANGMFQDNIASKYGVRPTCIWQVVHHKTWRNVA